MMTVPSKMTQYLDNRLAVTRSCRDHKYALSVTLITSFALSMIAYGLTHGGPIHLTGPMRDFAVVLPGLLATSTGGAAILAHYTQTIEKKRAKCGHQGLLRALVDNESFNDARLKTFINKMDINEARRFITYVRHHYFHEKGSLAKEKAKQAIVTFIHLNNELKTIYKEAKKKPSAAHLTLADVTKAYSNELRNKEIHTLLATFALFVALGAIGVASSAEPKEKPSAAHLTLADVTKAYSNELRNKQIHTLLATFGLFVALGAIGVASYAAATHPGFLGQGMTLSEKAVVIASGGYGAISLLAFLSIGSFLMTRKKYAAFNTHENLLEALNNEKQKPYFSRPSGNPLSNESYEAIIGHLYQQLDREDLDNSLSDYSRALTQLASFNFIEFITYFKTHGVRNNEEKTIIEEIIDKQLPFFIERSLLFVSPIMRLRELVAPLNKKTGIELDINPVIEKALQAKLRSHFDAILKKESSLSKVLKKIDSAAETVKEIHKMIFEGRTQEMNLECKKDALRRAHLIAFKRVAEKISQGAEELDSSKVKKILEKLEYSEELKEQVDKLTLQLIDRLAEEKDAFNFKERIKDIDAFLAELGKQPVDRGGPLHTALLLFLKKQWEKPLKKVDLEALERLQKEKTELFEGLKVKVGIKAKFRVFLYQIINRLDEIARQEIIEIADL